MHPDENCETAKIKALLDPNMHTDKNSETAEIKPLLDPNTHTVHCSRSY